MVRYRSLKEEASSLSRIFHHTSGGSNVVMLTACRSLNSTQGQRITLKDVRDNARLNQVNNKKLESDLRNLGYGYVKVEGQYMEESLDDTGEVILVPSVERSFAVFAPPNQEAGEKLLQDAAKLGAKYKQDSVLFKPYSEDDAYFYYTGSSKKGQTEKVGRWHPNAIHAYYSKLLNTKQKFQFR